MVDTNDYIYKFIGKDFQDKRKHSEVINKILAGYIDSDAYLGIDISSDYLRLRLAFSQSASNDPDFEILRSFQKFYNVGVVHYRTVDVGDATSRGEWCLCTGDTVKLLNIIGKHLIIKGKLSEFLLEVYDAYKGIKISQEEYKNIKEVLDYFRTFGSPLKRKKHPSWAWLSGYIAGDGHLICRLGRKRRKFDKKVDKYYDMTYNELGIIIVSSVVEPLEFLKEHLKGNIYQKNNYFFWKRSLGKGHKDFSLNFLVRIKPYMLHPKKYNKIERMIEHLRTSRD